TSGAVFAVNGFTETVGNLSGGGASGGNVTLGSGALTFGGTNADTTFAGAISGAGGSLVKEGTGVFTLSRSASYTGLTVINGRTFQPGLASVIHNRSSVVLASTAGVAFAANGFNETVGNLSGGGAAGGNVVVSGGRLTIG